MPVSMAALHCFLNLCLFLRSSTVRDDRLQSEEDKRFEEERHQVKETGLTFLCPLFNCYVQSKKLIRGEKTKRVRQREQR